MNHNIPYQLFGNEKLEKSIFLHGNGFPPKSYQSFLKTLSTKLNVYSMYQRPFWGDDINPDLIIGWDLFKNDVLDFLQQNNLYDSIAIGHSMGAVIILLIEIERPGTFKNIFLLDPVITSRFKSILYSKLLKIGLIDQLHPMIKRTNSKKMEYLNKEEIYTNYRKKYIFSKLNDENLTNYINSIIAHDGNGIKIKLSKKWENAIYRNGSIHDYKIWKNIKNINIPSYVILPKNNQFGYFHYGGKLKNKNIFFSNLFINDSTHLFPLEKPKETANLILSNINF